MVWKPAVTLGETGRRSISKCIFLKIVFLHLKKILNFQKCCKYNSGRLYFGEQFEHTLLCYFIALQVLVHMSYNQGHSPTSPQDKQNQEVDTDTLSLNNPQASFNLCQFNNVLYSTKIQFITVCIQLLCSFSFLQTGQLLSLTLTLSLSFYQFLECRGFVQNVTSFGWFDVASRLYQIIHLWQGRQ